jgi:hypothetical protein
LITHGGVFANAPFTTASEAVLSGKYSPDQLARRFVSNLRTAIMNTIAASIYTVTSYMWYCHDCKEECDYCGTSQVTMAKYTMAPYDYFSAHPETDATVEYSLGGITYVDVDDRTLGAKHRKHVKRVQKHWATRVAAEFKLDMFELDYDVATSEYKVHYQCILPSLNPIAQPIVMSSGGNPDIKMRFGLLEVINWLDCPCLELKTSTADFTDNLPVYVPITPPPSYDGNLSVLYN